MPRRRADLWRRALRFWDPPPLLAWRARRFRRLIERRAPGVALRPASAKTLPPGLRILTVDSVARSWRPLRIAGRRLQLRHAEGTIPPAQTDWLARQWSAGPAILLLHHYPLPIDPYAWGPPPGTFRGRFTGRLTAWRVDVPIAIVPEARDRLWRALEASGLRLLLCGHVHRARLERHAGIAVGLNGQSGAGGAGRTVAFYSVGAGGAVTVAYAREDAGEARPA